MSHPAGQQGRAGDVWHYTSSRARHSLPHPLRPPQGLTPHHACTDDRLLPRAIGVQWEMEWHMGMAMNIRADLTSPFNPLLREGARPRAAFSNSYEILCFKVGQNSWAFTIACLMGGTGARSQ